MSNAARKARRAQAKKARRAKRKTPKRGAKGRFLKGGGARRAAAAPAAAPRKRRKTSKRKGNRYMAKRKSTRKGKSKGRKTSHRGRRKGGGGRRGFMPAKDDIHLFMGAAAYGWAESKARADKDFVLNKLPKPIDQLGYTGNTALLLWGAGVLTKNKWIQLAARATAAVGIYQLATRGKLYDKGDAQFTLSGYDDDDVVAQIEGANMGALSPDANLPGGFDGGVF